MHRREEEGTKKPELIIHPERGGSSIQCFVYEQHHGAECAECRTPFHAKGAALPAVERSPKLHARQIGPEASKVEPLLAIWLVSTDDSSGTEPRRIGCIDGDV